MNAPVRLPSVNLDDVALFLDIDGTLIDIAPRPDEVVVPKSLLQTLSNLQKRTEGAMALVSGRALSDIDNLFKPLRLAAVGGHGAELRPRPRGAVDTSHAGRLDEALREELFEFASGRKGILIEDKGYSIAFHYRQVLDQEIAIRDGVDAICAQWPGAIGVLHGKAVVEVKHSDVNKGAALRRLMKLPPFAGRAPVFIGDDVTDEPAIAMMAELNGLGLSVGRAIAGATHQFKAPADVRTWLAELIRQPPLRDDPEAASLDVADKD